MTCPNSSVGLVQKERTYRKLSHTPTTSNKSLLTKNQINMTSPDVNISTTRNHTPTVITDVQDTTSANSNLESDVLDSMTFNMDNEIHKSIEPTFNILPDYESHEYFPTLQETRVISDISKQTMTSTHKSKTTLKANHTPLTMTQTYFCRSCHQENLSAPIN